MESSQGFVQFNAQHEPVRADDVSVPGMLKPFTLDETLTIGQHPSAPFVLGNDQGNLVKVASIAAEEPRGTRLANGQYAIVSRTLTEGAVLEVVQRPFQPVESAPLGRRWFFYFWDDLAVELPRNATSVNLADGIGEIRTLDGRFLFSFAGGGSPEELLSRLQGLRFPRMGIADGYWPTVWPDGVDVLALELYPLSDQETAKDIGLRVTRTLEKHEAFRKFILISKQYLNPRDTYPRSELPKNLQEAVRILSLDQRVVGLGIFSGPARAGGIGDLKELLPFQRDVFSHISGVPMSYVPVESHEDVVVSVWDRATPADRSRHAWIANAVAWELRKQGLDYFVNQKRGTQGDSEDAISTPRPDGAGGWAIIDIVQAFGSAQASPQWLDKTQSTIDGGTVGGGRLPTNPDPPPPSSVLERLARVEAGLVDLKRDLKEADAAAHNTAVVVDKMIKAIRGI